MAQLRGIPNEKHSGDDCGCHADEERAGRDPAYRRALWIVVILNVGFGLGEILAGFVANSQALKADALDFLGDGSITFAGLLALNWSASTRSRVAMAQGLFLGLLGLWVIGMAIWRALNAVPPDAELMGGVGFGALAVNVIAAMILSRFREGDAQARAVWLFSRNDAINNVAVIAAAALVYWLNSAWPDIIVAAVIAVMFLASAWEIVRAARSELGRKAG
jgi:cation diffusion facilitator family transporter